MKVSLYHPVLDRQIEVHERTVPIHEKAGWLRSDAEPEPFGPDVEPESYPESD